MGGVLGVVKGLDFANRHPHQPGFEVGIENRIWKVLSFELVLVPVDIVNNAIVDRENLAASNALPVKIGRIGRDLCVEVFAQPGKVEDHGDIPARAT